MANSRTNRLRTRNPGRRRVQNGPFPFELGGEGSGESAASARARRVAAEMADGMLGTAGADTARHSRDVERIALRIADHLGLSGEERQQVGIAARLHDIGKAAIPRTVLEKATQPTAREWELIYSHTVVGEQILRSIEELRPIAASVRHSHERWDGAGYPDGLRGEQIPAASRIIFCADAFHAICSDRPYRRGRSVGAALAEIRRCAGTQFEPRVVAALMQVVRTGLNGGDALGRVRRRSHARLSTVLVVALTLGGSVAGGFAAGRDASSSESIESFTPPPAATTGPSFETELPQLGPGPVPGGGVAGVVESFKAPAAGDGAGGPQSRHDPPSRAEPAAGPGEPLRAIESVTRAASDIGTRLAPSSGSSKGGGDRKGQVGSPGESPDLRDPGQAREEPESKGRSLPGLGAAEPLTYSLTPLGVTDTAPSQRGKRSGPAKKRR